MSTDVEVPDGWTEYTLGDLLELRNGVNADKSAYGRGLPFANVFEVIGSEALHVKDIPGRVMLSDEIARRYLVRRGDVLLNRSSEIPEEVAMASVYCDDAPIVFGGFVFRGRPRRDELTIEFSRYAFRSHRVREQIVARAQGGIRANIGQRDLRAVNVLLPSPQEQRAIAHALSDADELVQAIEQLIVKKEAIKQGLMQELLTGRTRLPGFSRAWQAMQLRDLLAYEQPGRYLVSSSEYGRTGTPVLTAGKTFLLGHTTETHGICTDVPVIIFDDFTTASQYVDFPFKAKSSAMKLLRARDGVDLRFIYARMQLIRLVTVDHKRRWIGEYSRLEIAVPPIAEQRAIAAVLADADDEITALRARLAKAKAVKQGMIQALLTGSTRMSVTDAKDAERTTETVEVAA